MTQEQDNLQDNIDILAILNSCLRRWYWFVLAAVVSCSLAMFYCMSKPAKYKVEGKVMFRPSDQSNMSTVAVENLLGMASNKEVDDEIQIFHSRSIYSQAIRELDLQSEYRIKKGLKWVGQYPSRSLVVVYPEQFLDTLRASIRWEVECTGDAYKVKITSGKKKLAKLKLTSLDQPITTAYGDFYLRKEGNVSSGDEIRISTQPMAIRVARFQAAISMAKAAKESNVVVLSTTTDMTRRDVDFIKKVIALYNLDAYSDKNLIASNTAKFIDERLRIISEELDSAELAVQNYKKSNDLTDISAEAQILLQSSNDVQRKLLSLETQKNIITYISDYIRQDGDNYSLIPANLGVDDQSVVSLIEQYNTIALKRLKLQRSATASNPVVTQLEQDMTVLRSNIVSTIASVKKSLDISINDLRRQESKYQTLRSASPKQEREYRDVVRKQSLKEQIYLLLYTKREETAITLASMVMPLRVIDEPQAEPAVVAPKRNMILLIAFALAICGVFAFFYIYDMLNTRITDKEKFKKQIKSSYVGSIVQSKEGESIAVGEGVNSLQAELFRTLRTNLTMMLPSLDTDDKRGKTILVTSAVSGEGKTYMAINTAISFALLGKKVAVVGLDIRKPMLANYLKLSNKGCLTSYLTDSSFSVDDCIVPSGVNANLDILPAGVVPPNPAELMLSPRLDALVEDLRDRYDYVFLDSAPIGLVSDSYLLDRLSDMTLFVSRYDYSDAEAISLINQVVEEHQLKHVASVLNGVKRDSAYGYGYGRYGHYGYGKYGHYGYGHYGYGHYDENK